MKLNNLFKSLLVLIQEVEEDIANLKMFCEVNNIELDKEVDTQSSYMLSIVQILKESKFCFGVDLEELDRQFMEKITDVDARNIFLEEHNKTKVVDESIVIFNKEKNNVGILSKELIDAIRCNIECIEPNPEGTDWKSVVNIQYISEEMEMLENKLREEGIIKDGN